jgi:Zn-dependent M28 family amino/carboxypeptidase
MKRFLLFAILLLTCCAPATTALSFDGERAYRNVVTQLDFGARIPGSEGHAKLRAWLIEQIEAQGWDAYVQESEIKNLTIYNILATRKSEEPDVLFMAHYDTREFADHDPDPALRDQPVPGASDGASGVAVLLELMRVIPADSIPVGFLFVDAEDQGGIRDQHWIVGSTLFAESLTFTPQAVILLDMIGDADLNLYIERNSDPVLAQEIWDTARRLDHDSVFIAQPKYSMIDDHIPFIERGIPAVDIIDFDYPYWHTTQDTADKLSVKSLQTVGETLLAWLSSAR